MKRILFFVLASFAALCSSAQIEFRKTYGGTLDDEGRSVKQTLDGGYIVAGTTASFANGPTDLFLVKTDSLGNMMFRKSYGGANIDRGYDVAQLSDSGYVLCGYTNSFGNGGYDGYLVRTDKNGDTLWTKTYGGTDWDFLFSVKPTSDNGFVLTGGTYSFGNGGEDVYVIKTNSTGDTLWTKTYGGNNEDVGNEVQQTADNGFIICGNTDSFGAGGNDVYLVRTNSAGDTLWTKSYGGIYEEEGNSVKQTPDNGFIVAGYTNTFSIPGYDDFYLIKTDANGDTSWTKTEGASDNKRATSIVLTSSGGYAFTGLTTGALNQDPLFWRTDANGNYQYSGSPGGLDTDIGYSIEQTSDNGFIIVGSTISFGYGLLDVFLVKTDSTGHSPFWTSVDAIPDPTYCIKIYPNPFNSSCAISIPSELISNNNHISFSLFNVLGMEVNSQIMRSGEKFFQIDRNGLPGGIYTFKITSEECILGIGKIVIQ